MVRKLIYSRDTHRFFDRYYCEIEAIRLEIMDMDIPLQWPQGDLKNALAWLAYEATARSIALNDLRL